MSDRDHQSRKDTERKQYDHLRRHGVLPDHARRIAEKASAETHKSLDRQHSAEGDAARQRKKDTGRAR